MPVYNRIWNEARKAKGFRSQADLDSFFRYHDHTKECSECQKPGRPVAIDDGYQPTVNHCEMALRLWGEWCGVHDVTQSPAEPAETPKRKRAAKAPKLIVSNSDELLEALAKIARLETLVKELAGLLPLETHDLIARAIEWANAA